MNDQSLAATIEALLFASSRPLTRKELIKHLGVEAPALEEALHALQSEAAGRGVVCIDDGTTVELRVAPHAAALVEDMRKEELSREVGKAGLEALSAILYRGPLTRAEVDFIRGVNSSQTLRTLLMRGLIRKVENDKERALPAGRRGSFLYEPTTELLAELGITHRDELPEYQSVRTKLQELEEAYRGREEGSPGAKEAHPTSTHEEQ